jgi:Fe-S-cluster containining protein
MSVGEKLRILHQEVSEQTDPIEKSHQGRLNCERSCHDCCLDDLSVFEIEANRIKEDFPELLLRAKPHPPGKCAFLDTEGACRIYESRPYVCRTQGLPLRWIVDENEYRDICVLNEEGPLIQELRVEECWTIGPYEGQLAILQADGLRVALRSLFSKAHKGS